MSYFLSNLIVENVGNNQNSSNVEKDEEFQKQYKDIYDALFSLNEQLKEINKYVRNINPKLYFLSDLSLMEIYSHISDDPAKALNILKYCYRGIDSFIISDKSSSESQSQKSQQKAILEIVGFRNSNDEVYNFDKTLVINEKYTTSLEFLSYVMKNLDEIPNSIKKKTFAFINENLQKQNFSWSNFCKSLLNYELKFQYIYIFMEICFYHNLTISLEMDELNRDNLLFPISKKQYLLADISDEETIRNHKLRYFYEKICKNLTEIIGSSKFLEYFKKYEFSNILLYNQFVLEIIKYKDILEDFINKGVNDTNNFYYLALPKLTFSFEKEFLEKYSVNVSDIFEQTYKKSQNIYEKLADSNIFLENESDFLSLALKNEYEIVLTTMSYRHPYAYNPVSLCDNWIYVPQNSQYISSLIGSLCSLSSNIICGSHKVGKKNILNVKKLTNFNLI